MSEMMWEFVNVPKEARKWVDIEDQLNEDVSKKSWKMKKTRSVVKNLINKVFIKWQKY